jgi:hypothetical protein
MRVIYSPLIEDIKTIIILYVQDDHNLKQTESWGPTCHQNRQNLISLIKKENWIDDYVTTEGDPFDDKLFYHFYCDNIKLSLLRELSIKYNKDFYRLDSICDFVDYCLFHTDMLHKQGVITKPYYRITYKTSGYYPNGFTSDQPYSILEKPSINISFEIFGIDGNVATFATESPGNLIKIKELQEMFKKEFSYKKDKFNGIEMSFKQYDNRNAIFVVEHDYITRNDHKILLDKVNELVKKYKN